MCCLELRQFLKQRIIIPVGEIRFCQDIIPVVGLLQECAEFGDAACGGGGEQIRHTGSLSDVGCVSRLVLRFMRGEICSLIFCPPKSQRRDDFGELQPSIFSFSPACAAGRSSDAGLGCSRCIGLVLASGSSRAFPGPTRLRSFPLLSGPGDVPFLESERVLCCGRGGKCLSASAFLCGNSTRAHGGESFFPVRPL